MEEFACLLVEGGLMDQPAGVLLEIRALRSFAEAKRLMDTAKQESDCPPWAIKLLTPVIERIYGAKLRAAHERTAPSAFGPQE